MRKLKTAAIASCLTAVLISAVSACGSSSAGTSGGSGSPSVRLSLSIPDPLTSSVGSAAQHFADQVAKGSNGAIKVTVIPNGTSFGGDQKASVTRLSNGSLDATIISTSVYAGSIKQMNAISLPYLFTSTSQVAAYLNGQPGKDLGALLESQDKIKSLAFLTRTPREVTNSKRPITQPSDLQGLKLRVPGNPLWTNFFSSFGASPTPLDFSEVFTALQTGTIDGQENPVEVPLSSKFYQVQKYLSMTNHMSDAFVLGVSDTKWNKLTAQQQKQLQDAATETAQFKTKNDATQAAAQVKELQQHGMKVNDLSPEGLTEFRTKARAMYPQFADVIGADFMNETTTFVDSH